MPSPGYEFAHRWFDEVWNKKRREAIAELMAPACPLHECGATCYGPEGFHTFFDRMQASFSDLHVTVEDTFEGEDRVCIRWSCTMKHTGGGLGMPATGKQLDTSGITIVRLANGQAVEAWQNWDMLGLMQQIQEASRAATYLC